MDDAKALVEEAMQVFFHDYDERGMRRLFAADYIQHNPHVPTGLEPVIGILPVLAEAKFGYEVHRIIQDGPLVLTHTKHRNNVCVMKTACRPRFLLESFHLLSS